MDYVVAGKRKTKADKRAKGRYNRYKKGGSLRTKKKQFEKKDKKWFLDKLGKYLLMGFVYFYKDGEWNI